MADAFRPFRIRLPVAPESIARARREVEPVAATLDARTADDLRLLVSELVTNSLRHAGLSEGDVVEVAIDDLEDAIRVEVTDDGNGFEPRPSRPGPASSSGWGLFLVSRLARAWGVSTDGRTTVWFELTRQAASAERPPQPSSARANS